MTPIDEAKELVETFTTIGLQQREEGIECALICAKNIFKALENPRAKIHWKSVIEQIEKIDKETY